MAVIAAGHSLSRLRLIAAQGSYLKTTRLDRCEQLEMEEQLQDIRMTSAILRASSPVFKNGIDRLGRSLPELNGWGPSASSGENLGSVLQLLRPRQESHAATPPSTATNCLRLVRFPSDDDKEPTTPAVGGELVHHSNLADDVSVGSIATDEYRAGVVSGPK